MLKNPYISDFKQALKTADHLFKLSEAVENSIMLLKENDNLPTHSILLKIYQFDTLFQQITFPKVSWYGETWNTFVSTWYEIRDEYFKIKQDIDLLHNSTIYDNSSDLETEKLICIPIKTSFGMKTISVVHGNLCKSTNEYDIVACSAYKKAYAPTPKTLIGSLLYDKNISVYMLSKDCELDFRKQGAWLSKEIHSNFHRIACIELLEYSERANKELVNLKSVFSTLSYLIEQAAIMGIPVKKIALPILGAGYQNIDTGYILSPLVTYCLRMLQCIEETEEIVFYEINEERANYAADRLQSVLHNDCKNDVFISYSSKQYDIAMTIYNALTENFIKCWMAPQSIPAGSQYYLEIPKAINSIKILILLLTQDAINSRFVPKEVSASLGAGKLIVPFQIGSVKLENGFDFLLEGEQIKIVGSIERINIDYILEEVNLKLLSNN